MKWEKGKKVTILITNQELNDMEDFLMTKQTAQEQVTSLISMGLIWQRLVKQYDKKKK